MFPVKVTLNELPGQVFVSVPFVSISTPFLDIMNFIETPYHLLNVAYHSWSSSTSLLHKLMICKLYFERYHVIPLPSPLEVAN